MRVLKFIIAHIQPYRLFVFGIFFAMCMIVICETMKPFVIKQFIEIASGATQGSLWNLLGYFATLQFMHVFAWALSDYSNRYCARARLDVVEYFTKHLYEHPYSFFQNQLTGSVVSKINDVFQQLPGLIFTLINPILYLIFLITFSLCLLYLVAPIFAITLIIWVLIFLVIIYLSLKKGAVITKHYFEEKSIIVGFTADYISNMISAKLFSNTRFEQQRFLGLKKPYIKASDELNFYYVVIC